MEKLNIEVKRTTLTNWIHVKETENSNEKVFFFRIAARKRPNVQSASHLNKLI